MTLNTSSLISYKKLSANAKCTRCKGMAEIHLPSHHANFCPKCFIEYFNHSVYKVIRKARIHPNEPIIVAISGGKDSLACWNVLSELGYKTEGLHIDLGIPNFSNESLSASLEFANSKGLKLYVYKLKEIFNYNIPEIRKLTRRTVCSVCGILKRNFLNRLALSLGYKFIATGHNLDDESSRLLGNILRNNEKHLLKTNPFLPVMEGLAGRIKPLFRLEGEEIKIYCQIKKINFFADKCPYSKGATSHIYKEALQFLERNMPGTKRYFLYTYVEKSPLLFSNGNANTTNTHTNFCKVCNNITLSNQCHVCKIKQELEKIESSKLMFYTSNSKITNIHEDSNKEKLSTLKL